MHSIYYISNIVNTKVVEFVKYQLHGGSNHLLHVRSIKTEENFTCLFYHLHAFHIKRTVKNIAKVLCLFIIASVRG